MTISVCIIAHNEEESLPRALASLAWVDEIVVVDCQSADGTVEAARKFTGSIFRRPNLPDLNINKNYSFDMAKSDWILCLDADEVVSPALAVEIAEVIGGGRRESGFFITRENSWFGRVLKHGGHFPDRQLRLFKRGKGKFPERHVHERLSLDGPVSTLKESLQHLPYRDISQYLAKMDFYTTFEARQIAERGRRFGVGTFLLAVARAKVRFFRRYVLKAGFLDGWQGFAAAYLDFLSKMVVEIKLRELQKK